MSTTTTSIDASDGSATVTTTTTISNDGSDGSATITTISATTNIPMEDSATDSASFEEGQTVLTYHGPCLYDAKVHKVEFHEDKWRYYVHYPGWNKNWDEWLSGDRLLKRTEENIAKQNELMKLHSAEKHARLGRLAQDKSKSTTGVKGKKRKHENIEKGCVVPLENLVNIQIPSTLKKQLVDDCESITQLGQLVKLPRCPTVYQILDKYFDYRVKKDGKIDDKMAEIVKGLRIYFDKALSAILLYRDEREQYKSVISDNVCPSNVYGAEHLLRLFVKLPDLLNSISIDTDTLAQLEFCSVDIVRFLHSNQSSFFLLKYQTMDGANDDRDS